MTGLDTERLVRYLTQDHPAQSAAAASEIEEAARSGAKLVISPIVLCEFVWVLESAYGRSRSEVAGALDRILRTAQFDTLEKDLLWPAARGISPRSRRFRRLLSRPQAPSGGRKEDRHF